jgi:hypothetical protein
MAEDQQSPTSEITILPDGRVYVLGMSAPLLEIVQDLQTNNARVRELVEKLESLRQEPKVG